MKIAIARSLLEPASLSWPEPYGHGKIPGWIIAELKMSFRGFEMAKMLPSAGGDCMSIQDVYDTLRSLAEMRGAERVLTSCMNIHRDTKWVGYMFMVRFSEPGKSKRHDVSLRTYFK